MQKSIKEHKAKGHKNISFYFFDNNLLCSYVLMLFCSHNKRWEEAVNIGMKRILSMIIAGIMLLTGGCITDAVSTSPSDQPVPAADTLDMGYVLTGELSPVVRLAVRNPGSKTISIGRISLRDDVCGELRLNVDGLTGREFSDVEIRPNDSILIFASVFPEETGNDSGTTLLYHLDMETRGVTRGIVIRAVAQDVTRLCGFRVGSDVALSAGKPYQVFDSLVVEAGATLTLEPGCHLMFHGRDASLRVYGSLKSLGMPGRQVELTADRVGNVAADIPYDVMSGQWAGLKLCSGSHDVELNYTSIRNTVNGVTADNVQGAPALSIVGSQLRNSQGYALDVRNSDTFIAATELTDAALGIVRFDGGSHVLNHCIIANYYLFAAPGGAALQLENAQADIANTIIYGNGSDVGITGQGVRFRCCLLKTQTGDETVYLNCITGTEPLFYTDREKYIFDYRLRPESPASGAADPAFTLPQSVIDRYGVAQPAGRPAIGAYSTAK